MNRILTLCTTFAVVIGVLAPSGGFAATRPDDRAGLIGVGAAQAAQAVPDVFDRAVARNSTAAGLDAVDRAVLRSTVDNRRPDDRAEARGPGVFTTVSPTAAATQNDGFAWSDALLGASAMLGVLLLGAAGALVIRHRGRVALR
jgi:hypothetical protein